MIENIDTHIEILELLVKSQAVGEHDLIFNIVFAVIVVLVCIVADVIFASLFIIDDYSQFNFIFFFIGLIVIIFFYWSFFVCGLFSNYNARVENYEHAMNCKEVYMETVDERKDLLIDINEKLSEVSLKTLLDISDILGSSLDYSDIKNQLCIGDIEKVREVMLIINQGVVID